jgi:hypothetical protein
MIRLHFSRNGYFNVDGNNNSCILLVIFLSSHIRVLSVEHGKREKQTTPAWPTFICIFSDKNRRFLHNGECLSSDAHFESGSREVYGFL